MTEAARLEGIIALTGLEKAQSGLVGLGKQVGKTQTGLDGLSAKSARASKQTDALGASLIRSGQSMSRAGSTMSRNVTLPLVALGAATLKVGADFEAQMSKVQAKSGATGKDMAKLRAQALQLGAQTSFSAREAAEGMEELAAAGMKPQQVLKAMPGLLDAAAASGEGVGAVAGIVANSLAQFNLEAGESTRIADVLAKGSNETQASIGSMGEALKYAGTQASQLGFDLEQTVGMTSMMVKAGIDGGQAGTALRMGLMQTAKGANASQIALKKLGSVSPELKNIWKSAAPVPEKIKLMSSEFQKLDGTSRTVAAGLIFGTEASSGMLEVMKGGPAQIDKWTASMRASGGEAKRMGDTMRNNLKGDIEALGGSFESAMIKMFAQADGPLRGITQNLTGAVNAFGNMGAGGQAAALGLGTLTAAAGPALLVTGKLVESYGSLKKAASGSAMASRFAALALNPYAIGAVALGAAVLGVQAAVNHARAEDEKWGKNAEELAGAVMHRKEAYGRLSEAMGTARSASAAMAAAEDKFGKDSAQYQAAAQQRAAALREVAAARRDVAAAEKEAADTGAGDGKGDGKGGMSDGEQATIRGRMIENEERLNSALSRQASIRRQLREAQDATARNTSTPEGISTGPSPAARIKDSEAALKKLNAQYEKGAVTQRDYADKSKKLLDTISSQNQKIDELKRAAKGADKTVGDLSGKVDRARTALGELSPRAQAASDALMKMSRTPANLQAAKDILKSMTAAERKVAFGTANINRILAMIGNVKPSSGWVTSFASDLQAARDKASTPIQVKVNLDVGVLRNFDPKGALGRGAGQGTGVAGRKSGGAIHGKGTGTSDEIPAWLSNGEHVLTAQEVRAAGGHGKIEMLRAMLRGGDMPRFAAGGGVGTKPLRGRRESKAAYNKRLAAWQKKFDAWNQQNASATSTSDLAGAAVDADTSDPALQQKKAAATAALRQASLDQQTAIAGKPAAASAARSTKQAADRLQARYDAISGKDAAANAKRKALKPSLDKAKKAAAAAQSRYDKLLETIQNAGDKRRSLASEITGYGSSLSDSSTSAEREAEDIRREALGLESVDDEKHREAINRVRRAAGLPELQRGDSLNADGSVSSSGGGGTGSEDLAAQLAQSQQRAAIAEQNYRMGQGELAAFSSPGDIGFGRGRNAYQSAAPTIVIQSLTGYSPEIQQTVSDAAGGGFAAGGNSYRMYSGRG